MRTYSLVTDVVSLACIDESSRCRPAEHLGLVRQCDVDYAGDVARWRLYSDSVRRYHLHYNHHLCHEQLRLLLD